MEIVDAHAHVYERLAGFGPRGEGRAVGGGVMEWATGEREQFLRPEDGDLGFSYDRLVERMDEAGISRAVLLQCCNYGFANGYVAEAVTAYPDRFLGVGVLDPFCGRAADIFRHLTETKGFSAVKLDLSERFGLVGYHPELAVDGEVCEFLFSLAEERGVPVTLDTGPLGTRSLDPEAIARVLDRHPRLTLVLAHALFPSPTDGRNGERLAILRSLAGADLYVDTASLAIDTPAVQAYLRAATDLLGVDRVMFGTDVPGALKARSYATMVDAVRPLFSTEELPLVLGQNALRVYGKRL
ncbi:MAG: amidohydrolase [Clostridia bacterium]|nr:amidohydrolase [Clostridia bacterium]